MTHIEVPTFIVTALPDEKRGEKLGEKRGEKRKTIEIVKRMLENGDKAEYIMKITDLTREEVLAIKKEMDL